MARLFDAYLIADWTAAETRKRGDQSLCVWLCKGPVLPIQVYMQTGNIGSRSIVVWLLVSAERESGTFRPSPW